MNQSVQYLGMPAPLHFLTNSVHSLPSAQPTLIWEFVIIIYLYVLSERGEFTLGFPPDNGHTFAKLSIQCIGEYSECLELKNSGFQSMTGMI